MCERPMTHAEGRAAGLEEAAAVCDAAKVKAGESSDWWAARGQGQTAGFAQSREAVARECAAAIRALKEKP